MLRLFVVLHRNDPVPEWWLGDDILFKFDTKTFSQFPILSSPRFFFRKRGGGHG